MALFDIACLIIFGLSTLFGLIKGFVHQVIKAAGLAGAVLIIIYFRPEITAFLNRTLGIAHNISSYIVIPAVFFGIFIIVSILCFIARHKLKNTRFGPADRILGLVLGALKGAALCAAVFYVLVQFPGSGTADFLTENRVFCESWAAQRIITALKDERLRPYVPVEFIKNAEDSIREPEEKKTFRYIPELFWARYAARSDSDKRLYINERSGVHFHTEMRVTDIEDREGTVTLMESRRFSSAATLSRPAPFNIEVKMVVRYNPAPEEERFRIGETLFIIGRLNGYTFTDGARPHCTISAEAAEVKRIQE